MPRPYRFGHPGARERLLGLDRENGPLTPTAVRRARPGDATELARLRWDWSRIDRDPVTPSATALAETGAQLAEWMSALGSGVVCAVAVAGSRLIELLLASVDDRRVGFLRSTPTIRRSSSTAELGSAVRRNSCCGKRNRVVVRDVCGTLFVAMGLAPLAFESSAGLGHRVLSTSNVHDGLFTGGLADRTGSACTNFHGRRLLLPVARCLSCGRTRPWGSQSSDR